MGTYVFVMMASARLSRTPIMKPLSHPGHGNATAPITNPMEKRLMNAQAGLLFLSGNVSGSIEAADNAP